MNNGRYVNKDTIIKRVQQYYGLDASGKDVDDFIYDGLRGLGTYNMYDFIATSGINDMPEPIKIKNYRGFLPSNIEYPIQAFDYDTKIPMMCKNNIFKSEFINYYTTPTRKSYELKRSHIFSNTESHKIVLVYLGFPVDDSGHPLVPDNEEYLKAITAYVAKSIAFPLNLKKQISDKVLLDIERAYFSYAHGVHTIEEPNVDQTEMIKNQMLNWLPDYTSYNNGFNNIGSSTDIKYI
jgi:hypothetical protein